MKGELVSSALGQTNVTQAGFAGFSWSAVKSGHILVAMLPAYRSYASDY